MDTNKQIKRRDVRDVPISKPSDPLPSIFDSVRHSGFTTARRSDSRMGLKKHSARLSQVREKARKSARN